MDTKYRDITIDYTKVGAALTNFPIYVQITLGSNVANSNGYDVHFKNASGTELPFELTNWNNTTKTWSGWVKVDSISNTVNTVIKVYYGNTSIITNQSSTTTWDASFRTVHHLNETGGTIVDSTSNGVNLIPNVGTRTYSQTAKTDTGVQLNNADFISDTTTTVTDFSGAFTISAWFNYSSAAAYAGVAGNLQDNTANGWTMEINGGTPNIWINNNTVQMGPVSTGAWHYMVATRDNSNNVYVYMDGSLEVTGSVSGTVATGRKYTIGSWGNTSYMWTGSIDEVRTASTARSAGWITTEYNNQNNPATFSALGTETAISGSNEIPVTGLLARYEARLQTPVADNTNVTTMPDQSGNGYNLFQTETAQKYRTNIVNGQPSYYFAGNGAYQASNVDYPALAITDSELTISVIVNSNAAGGSRTWPFGLTQGDSTSIFAFTDGASAGKWGAFLRGANNTGQIYYTTSDDTVWAVLTLVYDGSTIKSYINGTEVDSKAATGSQVSNRISMGKIVGQTWEGYLAGAFIWRKGLDATERASLHSYVQDTYGITVSDYISPPSGGSGLIKVWNGSSWVRKPIKVWNGTLWVQKPVKVWSGANWVTTNPSGPPVMPP